jgi:hypothetical protein
MLQDGIFKSNYLLFDELLKQRKICVNDRKSHVTLKCNWKRKVLLSICVKVFKKVANCSTINLPSMIETTKPPRHWDEPLNWPKAWSFYILESCGVHYRHISSIPERTHLSFTMLTNHDNVFPIWYVEYLSSLWMSFKGQSYYCILL